MEPRGPVVALGGCRRTEHRALARTRSAAPSQSEGEHHSIRRKKMRRKLPLAVLAATLGVVACEQAPTLAPESAAPAASRSENAPIYLVTFKPGVDVQSTAAELARARGFSIRFIREFAAPGFSAVIPASQIESI